MKQFTEKCYSQSHHHELAKLSHQGHLQQITQLVEGSNFFLQQELYLWLWLPEIGLRKASRLQGDYKEVSKKHIQWQMKRSKITIEDETKHNIIHSQKKMRQNSRLNKTVFTISVVPVISWFKIIWKVHMTSTLLCLHTIRPVCLLWVEFLGIYGIVGSKKRSIKGRVKDIRWGCRQHPPYPRIWFTRVMAG